LTKIAEVVLTCVEEALTCFGAILGGGFLFEQAAALGTKSEAALTPV